MPTHLPTPSNHEEGLLPLRMQSTFSTLLLASWLLYKLSYNFPVYMSPLSSDSDLESQGVPRCRIFHRLAPLGTSNMKGLLAEERWLSYTAPEREGTESHACESRREGMPIKSRTLPTGLERQDKAREMLGHLRRKHRRMYSHQD